MNHTRRAALDEQSVLHVISKQCDGVSKYWVRMVPQAVKLSDSKGKEKGRALGNALADPVYRDAMLSEAIADWENYRHHNVRCRMIVICSEISSCREVVRYIKDHHPRWVPVLAVSKTMGDEQIGTKAVEKFRDHGEGHILVTCQMAYEGLDVPDCTHLVCLTNIRTRSWLEQAFARVTRFDPDCGHSWEAQCAYLYAPADSDMVRFLSEWLDEQDSAFVEPKPRVGVVRLVGRKEAYESGGCDKGETLYGDSYGVLGPEEQANMRRFEKEYPDQFRLLPFEHSLALTRGLWPIAKREAK